MKSSELPKVNGGRQSKLNKNDRLLRALLRQEVDVTPVWMMRQAGRYLPEYRKIRSRAGSFMDLCMNPELACEVTIQPLRRFPLDAAISFPTYSRYPTRWGWVSTLRKERAPDFHHPIQDERP